MASKHFSWQSFFVRFVFALLLVYATYNPSGYSYFHWTQNALFGDAIALTPPFAFCGIVLIIGWTIYLRATLRSLGGLGLTLAMAFFAVIIWWLIYDGLLKISSFSVFAYIILFLLSAVLAVGMSWSHIRRRMSGQLDTDDVDEN